MKNYKITCPSIFINHLVVNYLDFYNLGSLERADKWFTFTSNISLDDIHNHFAGTPFDIVIQELDNNGNLVKQKITP